MQVIINKKLYKLKLYSLDLIFDIRYSNMINTSFMDNATKLVLLHKQL